MKSFKRIKKSTINYFYDHPIQREIIKNIGLILVTVLSGFIFAFGFKAFIQPNYDAIAQAPGGAGDFVNSISIKHLASCGASGLSQIIITLLKIFGCTYLTDNSLFNLTYWLCYLSINIPLFFLGFFKVGKRFAIYSILNVACASLFGVLLPNGSPNDFINQITMALGDNIVPRVLFGAVTTAFASVLAYSIETTAGGTDLIAYYISERKSVPVGKWSATLNVIVVSIYSLLNCIPLDEVFAAHKLGSISLSQALVTFLFTALYMIIVSLVVDQINVTNKKVSLQITTQNENLSKIIITNIPHSCTVVRGEGGYTGKPVFMLYMTVRKREAKKVVKISQKVDPSSFITVLPTEQVYGRFFRKPIK